MSNSEISISTVSYNKKEDLRILNACLSSWFSDPKTLHFVHPEMTYPFKIKHWINLSYLNKSTTFILKYNNWIIGHLSIRINKESESAHLFHLIIDSDYQRNGYAKKLIIHAEKVITKKNINKININVMKKNQIAKKLYNSLGYLDLSINKSGKIKLQKNLV